MPSGSHDELPPVEFVPGYSSRMADWGGMTVAFEKAHAGQDASAKIGPRDLRQAAIGNRGGGVAKLGGDGR